MLPGLLYCTLYADQLSFGLEFVFEAWRWLTTAVTTTPPQLSERVKSPRRLCRNWADHCAMRYLGFDDPHRGVNGMVRTARMGRIQLGWSVLEFPRLDETYQDRNFGMERNVQDGNFGDEREYQDSSLMTKEFLTNQWHYLTQRQKVALPILIILPALRPTPLLFERILVSIVANVFVLEMIKRLPGPPLNQKIRWFVIVLIAVLVVWCRSLPVEIHDDVFNAKDGKYNTYIYTIRRGGPVFFTVVGTIYDVARAFKRISAI